METIDEIIEEMAKTHSYELQDFSYRLKKAVEAEREVWKQRIKETTDMLQNSLDTLSRALDCHAYIKQEKDKGND